MRKYKTHKILIWGLIGIMIAMFYSCSKDHEGTPGGSTEESDFSVDSPGDTTEVPPSAADIYDLALYQIVYPSGCKQEIIDLSTTLCERLSSKIGTRMALYEDRKKDEPDSYEILIGLTNREVSVNSSMSVRYNDYLIRSEGNKIVIYAWNQSYLKEAITHFLLSLEKKDGIYYWSGSYLKEATYEIESMELAGHSISDYQIRIPHNAGKFVKYTAGTLKTYIGEKSGYIIDVVSDASAASDTEILIGFGSDCDTFFYQIEARSGKIEINAGSGTAYLGLCGKWGDLFGGHGNINLSVNDLEISGYYYPLSFGDHADLRIMTSNVLFTTGKGLYDDAARMECLMQTYLAYLPDVLCLQEARNTQFDLLVPWLEDSYASVNYVCDDGGQVYQKILYRKDLYRAVEYGFTRFRTKVIPWGVSWVVLERISDGKRFAVTNTHLTMIAATYDPDKTDKVDGVPMRRANCEVVLQIIENIRNKYPSIPVFSTGDWNSQRDGEALAPMNESEYMRNAMLIAEQSADLNTNSGHAMDQYPSSGTNIIDHIFCSTDVVRVLIHKVIVNDTVIHGSDHCPVYANFVFR